MTETVRPEESYKQVARPWLVQVSVGLSVAVTTMDTGSINLSLHTLGRTFGIDAATVAWLPLVAFLTVTSTLLLFGRLSDVLGSKRVFVTGFGVYAVGSFASGFAPSFALLLVTRGIQAIGLSMLSANSVAILTECFPPQKRGTVLGINSTLVGLGFFVGPIVAGTLITALGWRYVFFASIPLCLVGIIVGMLALPRSSGAKRGHFDLLGALVFAVSAVSLLLAVNAARSSSLTSLTVLGFICGFGLALAAFIVVERRALAPMLDLSLFRIRLFSLSLVSAFAVFLGMSGQDFLVPLLAQQVLVLDPATAGAITATVPLMRMSMSWPSGFLSDRLGSRWLAVFGAVLAGIGLFGLSRMDASATVPSLILCLATFGVGTGVFFSPNMHATMSSLPADRIGMAAGAVGLRRNLGQSFGVALAAYLLQIGSGGASASVPGFQLAFSLQTVFLAIAVLAAFASGSTVVASGRRASSPVRS